MIRKVLEKVTLILFILFLVSCSHRIYYQAVAPETSESVLELALTKMGEPYVYAGRGPDSFDCSGLITWSYKEIIGKDKIFLVQDHLATDANMNDLYKWNTTPLHPEQIQPGDIIFITNTKDRISHGGLFVEWVDENTMKFLNASSYHNRIAIDNWPLQGKKRGQWFVGAGRLNISSKQCKLILYHFSPRITRIFTNVNCF